MKNFLQCRNRFTQAKTQSFDVKRPISQLFIDSAVEGSAIGLETSLISVI